MLDYKKLIEVCLEKGIEEVEITESTSKEMELNFFNGALENNTTSDVTRITVKALIKGKDSTYDIENLNLDYSEIADVLLNNIKANNSNEVSSIFEGSEEYPVIEKVESDFEEYSIEEKINLLASIEKELKSKDERIVHIPQLCLIAILKLHFPYLNI